MAILNHWILTVLLLTPLCGAGALGLLPRRQALIRRVALATTLTACAFSLLILAPFRWRQAVTYGETRDGTVKLALRAPLPFGADYHVGVDGLSFPFLVFTTLIFAVLCVVMWNDATKGAAYYATLLVFEFAAIGTYISFDFLMLFGFLALSAVMAYALMRSFHDEQQRPARGMLIYLLLGLLCLAALLVSTRSAVGTFDLIVLGRFRLENTSAQRAVFIIGVFGLIARMAAVPFHSWLVMALTKSAVPIAIAIASVIPVSGAYGLMRVALPLFPHAADGLRGAFAALGVVGFLYGALCAISSDDLWSFIAYSMVSMMGCVLQAAMLRIAAAIDGAVLLLIGQSVVGAMALILAGAKNTQQSGERPPLWTAFFSVASVLWLTVPVMLGQLGIVMADFEAARFGGALHVGRVALPGPGYGLAVAASFGLLANGAAAARMIRRIFMQGISPVEGQAGDLASPEVVALTVLGVMAVLIGVVPGVLIFTFTHPAVRSMFHAN